MQTFFFLSLNSKTNLQIKLSFIIISCFGCIENFSMPNFRIKRNFQNIKFSLQPPANFQKTIIPRNGKKKKNEIGNCKIRIQHCYRWWNFYVFVWAENWTTITVWVFPDKPTPTKVIRSLLKKMIACFFGLTGHFATIPLEDRKTINAKRYAKIYFPKVINEIR